MATSRLSGRPLTAPSSSRCVVPGSFGATGTVLMAIGSLGAGARPVVQDPTFGVRLLNLPSRIQTVSLTMTTTGAVMMALAWLMLGRFALGKRRMSRSQLDRTLLLWILPLLIAPPMYSKDVYSYLAQSEISRLGLDPVQGRPGAGARASTMCSRCPCRVSGATRRRRTARSSSGSAAASRR